MERAGLEQRQRELASRMRELTASMRAAQRSDRKREARAASAWGRHIAVAVRILACTAPDVHAVKAYHRHIGGGKSECEAFVAQVSDAYLATPEEMILEFSWPVDMAHRAHSLAAQRFLVQHRVHDWITAQNNDKGVAPGIGDVLRQRQSLRDASQTAACRRRLFGVSKGGAYRWARRFRVRWKLRALQSAEHELESLEVTRAKVAACQKPCTTVELRGCAAQVQSPPDPEKAPPGQKIAPEQGPFSGPKIGTACKDGTRKRARFPVQLFERWHTESSTAV